ncbi:hypothetical protein RLEG12_13490 [Rhizobium leguminosarum bv. trifolii CB782]|nr:hypothetical protein RLEG12_13490 [Rhizobium leguminosarum bv. trifolii CB782]
MTGTATPNQINVSRDVFLSTAAEAIKTTDVVLDVGCGIRPMNYFRPKLHFMVEPWKEYADILAYRYRNDKSVMIFRQGALEALQSLGDKSVDSIFLLDVIEHLTKEMGISVVAECERVARQQIAIFTPLGFMPQHMEEGQKDGWGLSGASVQEHLSGWMPDDFGPEWTHFVCPDFHQHDFKSDSLNQAFGAFFAIRDFNHTPAETAAPAPELQEPLPSELQTAQLRGEVAALSAAATNIQMAYDGLKNSTSVRAARAIRAIISK